MKWQFKRSVMFLCVLLLLVAAPAVRGGFTFSQPELRLVEDGSATFTQTSMSTAFDEGNSMHATFTDSRSGMTHIYGSTVLPGGDVLDSFRGYNGLNPDAHDTGRIIRSPYESDKMYVLGINASASPNYEVVLGEWDLTTLPGTPTVTDISSVQTATTAINGFTATSVVASLIFAYDNMPNIHVNRYDLIGSEWDPTEIVVSTTEEEMHDPVLAVDDDGYIYLAYWQYGTTTTFNQVVVRRSADIEIIQTGFLVDHYVTAIPRPTGFDGIALAVTGGFGSGDLKVAVAFEDSLSTDKDLQFFLEENGDWTEPTFNSLPAITLNSDTSSFINLRNPSLAYGADHRTLYAVWVDDRAGNDEIYGAVSYDGGLTFEHDVMMTMNAQTVTDGPFVATGSEPGFLSVGYIRNSVSGISPFARVSNPEFLDGCDTYPPANWDSYSGISVITTPYHSPPAAFEMASGKGQLLRDYGTTAHYGNVDMYFYDDISNQLEDFAVGMDDGNSKGVIRMLGVKNSVNPDNYAYCPDGVNWQDWGVPRSTGWHHVVMNVTETGLIMSLEYEQGGIIDTVQWADPAFTQFTSIFIQGGSATQPYYVDDIQVEAYPVGAVNPVVPAVSPAALAILGIAFGLWIRRNRRH